MDTQPCKRNPTILGPCRVASPLPLNTEKGDAIGNFVPEDTWVRYAIEVPPEVEPDENHLFEKAGAREKIFFKPPETRAAVATCGGLSPGLNNVIRSLFLEVHYNYGIAEMLGLRYGYRGLNPAGGQAPILLTPEIVERIDKQGGTILGTSRGAENPADMVDFLEQHRIDILFCVGGDGTLRGAHHIAQEVARRQRRISVIGIPKTIDNDIAYCSQTFGYVTALGMAREALRGAHNEASSAYNGIGLVKLMGRYAGFIAAGATLASQEVNFTLIPEVPFGLEGRDAFLALLERRLHARQHAVIVVAEGAGQELFSEESRKRDASGNLALQDIGALLKRKIGEHLKSRGISYTIKYIDPSYLIRSLPANSDDSIFCDQFARRAAHAAMAGRTDILIGHANDAFFHVPLALSTARSRCIDPEGELWKEVLATTGQPSSMK